MTEGWCITGLGSIQPCCPPQGSEGGRGCLQQGRCGISSPGRPPAGLLKWTVGVGHTSNGKEDKDRERI